MISSPATHSSDSPSVLVVIVNYRTAALTIDCLESLRAEAESMPNLRVVVTDNASGDDSVAAIGAYLQQLPDSAARHAFRLQPLPENGGFAYGNNQAIRPALASDQPPDYVLLLNPDTVVRPGAIRQLLEFMQSQPRIGIAGSRLEDPDGTPQYSAFRFPSVASELDQALRFGPVSRILNKSIIAPPIPNEQTPTDWVAGASMMVRREVFEAIGVLDERYFMYYEEVDFCWRARQAGWACWYVPESRVVHLVGQASGVTNTKIKRKRRPAYWFESRRRYFLRNAGVLRTMGCDLAQILGLSLWQVRCLLERKTNNDPPRLLWDCLRQSVFCKGFNA
jgi:N-acetylglucosaminyl-diphospho-decaprenol L-rhamnosyltransferase